MEGYRTDVRVVNLNYLSTDWYAEQMHNKSHDAPPLPLSFKPNQYRQGTRDYIRIVENKRYKNKYIDAKTLVNFIKREDPQAKLELSNGDRINYLPTRKFSLPVNKKAVLKNGIVESKQSNKIVDSLEWSVKTNYLTKAQMLLLDILANNNWERPIHFSTSAGRDTYFGLENYFQLDGLTYRLLPIHSNRKDGLIGSVNSQLLYNNLVTKFKWGGIDTNPELLLDSQSKAMFSNLRLYYIQLIEELIKEGDFVRAKLALDLITKNLPHPAIPFSGINNRMASLYFRLNFLDKGKKLANQIIVNSKQKIKYYLQFDIQKFPSIKDHTELELSIYGNIVSILDPVLNEAKKKELKNDFTSFCKKYQSKLNPMKSG